MRKPLLEFEVSYVNEDGREIETFRFWAINREEAFQKARSFENKRTKLWKLEQVQRKELK